MHSPYLLGAHSPSIRVHESPISFPVWPLSHVDPSTNPPRYQIVTSYPARRLIDTSALHCHRPLWGRRCARRSPNRLSLARVYLFPAPPLTIRTSDIRSEKPSSLTSTDQPDHRLSHHAFLRIKIPRPILHHPHHVAARLRGDRITLFPRG